jgi:hypothetical protein
MMACGSGHIDTVGLTQLAQRERACRSHADTVNAFASPSQHEKRIRWPKSVAKWTWTNIRQPLSKYVKKGSQNGLIKSLRWISPLKL